MPSLIDRLNTWRELLRADFSPEEPEVEAGRAAEEFLRNLVETNLKYKGAYTYLGKRVPSIAERRRYEIDLIVLTKKHLHAIEVKNWSGELLDRGENWVQIRKNGEQIIHPNLSQYNLQKHNILVEYLKIRGLTLDETYFLQKIVFMNRRLTIPPSIACEASVVTASKLQEYLGHQRGASFAERFVHSVIELCLDSEESAIVLDGLFHAMTNASFNAAQEALSLLETWDKIVLHGGRILSGDAIRLETKNISVDLKALPSGTRCPVEWIRSKILGLVQSLLSSYPLGCICLPSGNIPVEPNDILTFHAAGDRRPSEILMKNVDMVLRG